MFKLRRKRLRKINRRGILIEVLLIMSETSVIGEDSDEDKVVFLDYESTCTEKHSTVKVKTPRRERPNKFQSLFQQKRYKDDVSNLCLLLIC